MHWLHSLTYRSSKVLAGLLETWKFIFWCETSRNIWKPQHLAFQVKEKKVESQKKLNSILYNLNTADRMEVGFSLNNKPERAENMSGWTTHKTLTISQISWCNSPVRPIKKNIFLIKWIYLHLYLVSIAKHAKRKEILLAYIFRRCNGIEFDSSKDIFWMNFDYMHSSIYNANLVSIYDWCYR